MALPRTIYRHGSRPIAVVFVFAASLMLSGCWVSSVNGLVQESNFTVHTDSDVVVDQRLAGTWEATTDNCTTTLTITLKERTYHLASTEKGEKCVAPETDYRQAHLVKLDDHFFFDVFPAPDDVCDMCLPLHWIFLVKFDENLLSLTPIDSNWLKKSVEQKTVVLATMPGDTDKITASVKDLKAFCRKYGDDKEAFVATSDDVSVARTNRGRERFVCHKVTQNATIDLPHMTTATLAITPEVLRDHGLTADEYDRIRQLLGREPSFTELGIFSVMWSEHCSYKSSRVHLKRLPTHSRRVLQGPGENAGIIDIGDGWACAFKIESHNHPSFIEPFQGATTGVGGILRDIFTMGARPVAVMDSLRFGPISVGRAPSPATSHDIHRNHSILEGVVSGIASYGNCFGVPNLGGETKFEPCYSGNPLVNAFALGLVRKDQIFYAKASGEGNPVIYVGAKTGRDGIHGATMASEEFSEESEAKRPNVQVGDPFLEKLLLEACLEAMQTGAVIGIQDMGAAGLTCSTCEMGARGGVGLEIEMDRVPQRETGMNAYEILLSESQERMLLVAQKGREEEVFKVFRKWGLDAVEVGRVISSSHMRVLEHGQVVADIPNTALTDDAPVYRRPLERWEPPVTREMPEHVKLGTRSNFTDDLKQLLASENICSKRWIYQQYDSMVQTNTVEGPGLGDGGMIRIKGSQRALAMALDGNGRWCYLDPKLGAMHAVAEASRNVACTGATPVGATNCLNFGNPEKPHIMWQFSQVIDGITKACEELEIPITGGNVSFYNETLGEGIYPTPVLGVVGILEDVNKAAFPHFRVAGRAVVLLRGSEPGDAVDAETEFGSSEYAKEILGQLWGFPPALELEAEASTQKAIVELIGAGLVDSVHDCSEGGLAAAFAKAAFRAEFGCSVDLASAGLAPEFVLFGEDASRIVISCDPANLSRIKQVAGKHGVFADAIGETASGHLEIKVDGATVISASIAELRDVYENALERALRSEPAKVAAD